VPTLDRQRALARAKLERQMARRAAAARRRRQVQAALGAVIALVVVIGGTWYLVDQFSGDDSTKPSAKPEASAEPSPAASLAPGNCTYGKSQGGEVKNVGTPPTKGVVHEGVRAVTLTTSAGPVEFELDQAKAPCTVNSFTFLADKKYFDNTQCHRLTTSGIYVLQCGDPSATGTGGPGYQYGEENLPKDGEANYPKGTLAMAKGGPGTNGSQFFIVYKDTKLPPDYTIFGKVTKGLENVEKVAKAGVEGGTGDGKPKTPVKITKVTLAAAK
jgi:peptidyl-prolyl cis-trans isomerase B (cyclophilin B)